MSGYSTKQYCNNLSGYSTNDPATICWVIQQTILRQSVRLFYKQYCPNMSGISIHYHTQSVMLCYKTICHVIQQKILLSGYSIHHRFVIAACLTTGSYLFEVMNLILQGIYCVHKRSVEKSIFVSCHICMDNIVQHTYIAET